MLSKTQKSNLSSILKVKHELKKYCYFNENGFICQKKTMTHDLINQCDDEDFLKEAYILLIVCCMCIYFENRTIFNRLRRYFMEELLQSLCLKDSAEEFHDKVVNNYNRWCESCGVSEDDFCDSLCDKALTKIESIDLFIDMSL